MKPRTLLLRGITALPALVALAAPSVAHAQADMTTPLPNVMLLIDTSGSMEYEADGTLPTCNPASTASVNDRSRWVDILEVLTGTIDNYTCDSVDRTASAFKTGEYALGGTPPYDYLYPLAYHRPISNGCTPAPGVQSSNPFIYPAGAIGYHVYNSATTCTTWSQVSKDGLLDAYRNDVRFGLMTFDTLTDAGTGFTGTMASATANATTGKAGLWSYTVGSTPMGAPSGCATSTAQEVGARNAAAPAWEGRMVNFGNPYDAALGYPIKNDHIQDVLRATRPYGATPIAGMMRDVADFFLKDTNKDPDRYPTTLPSSDVAADFGPYQDPYGKCPNPRKQIIILLTDGQPNMDLRPYCSSSTETPPGVCPFNKPEEIAGYLYDPTTGPLSNPAYTLPAHNPIPTFVVGFALDQVDDDNNPATPTKDCTKLTPAEVNPNSTTSLCGNPANASNAPLQACCALQRIAIAGGTGRTYFSVDKVSLKKALNDIVSSQLSASSRTQPVPSGGNGSGSGGGMTFFSAFVPATGGAWQGRLERQRIVCDDTTTPGIPTPKPIDESSGDNFEKNVSMAGNPDSRRIYTMLGGATVSDPLKPASTIRPLIGTDKDGAGAYGGRSFAGFSRYFVDNLPTGATLIPTASCINQNLQVLTTAACQKQYLEWWAGYDNGQSTVLSRCVGAKECHLLGDIVHSTPAVVDRPLSAIRDESFTRFSYQQRYRPKVLYTSTNDGMLHAFKVASNDPADATDAAKKVLTKTNNELWTFVPPATLPVLYTLYPRNHQVLLDGVPTVMNVVAQPASPATNPPTVFERSQLAAQQGNAVWRTILVQSFGKLRPGYFAVDVTNPVPDSSSPDDVTKGGPRMLWQLTGDKTDKNLFGAGGGTPTITTLFFDPLGGSDVREIPVAILPGGPGGTVDNSIVGGCPAGGRTYTDVTLDSSFPPRSKVRCYTYGPTELGARSLTIVRLDTGEIIRTFRQSKTEVATELQPRVTEVPIDSPIVGQPSAFPGFTGEVADRIFVGDLDGRLWRLNVASSKPADWTMKLFMDLYPSSFPAATGRAYSDGQAITAAPVVSVDNDNNLVLNVSTGDQDNLGAATPLYNYVYSLTEKANAAHTGFATKVNWYYEFTGGERVVGPMVLFNSQLYFGSYLAGSASDVCAMGTSKIWGMNYVTPENASTISLGGKTVFINTPPNTPPQLVKSFTSTIAFGPQVMQQPSCATEVDTLLGDGLVGFGHQVSLSNIQTGGFQLVFQTGSNTTGSKVQGASVGVQTIDLPPPPALSTVSAWASIVE